jgi:hypothetical protein
MSTFDPSALMSLLQGQGGDSAPDSLSGSNKYAIGPSSNNQTPDQPQPAQTQQPPPANNSQNAGPVKAGLRHVLASMLGNFSYGAGQSMIKASGGETDAEKTMRMAQIAHLNAQTQLTQQQAQMVPYQLPNGTTLHLPQKMASDLIKQQLANQGKTDAAQIGANARLGAAQISAMARLGQVKMKAAYGPDGSLAVGLYDNAGNFKGYADNAIVPPGYLEKIHQGQEVKVTADGQFAVIPTTSVSKPLIPGAPQGTAPKGKSPGAPGAAPVTPGVKIIQGISAPSAADTVYATDPKNGQTIFTDRSTAAAQGMTNLQKVTPVQRRKDEALSNRLADVQRKVGDYAETFDQPIDGEDAMAISYILDNNIGAGLSTHGLSVNLLPKYWQDQLKAKGIRALSENGMKRMILFNQARESLSGYQQILTNSSRSSDKVLELQLEQLPPPLADKQFADMTTGQFQQNLDLAGQHMPVFPGSAENQQTIKAQQANRRAQTAAIQANQAKGENIPQRPANVPGNYIFKENGPKGRGWYKP